MAIQGRDNRGEPRPGVDFAAALEHAERMLESFDRAAREMRALRAVQVAVVVAALLVAALVAASSDAVAARIGLALVPVVVAVLAVSSLEALVNVARRQRERDLSGLVQISRVARDLLSVVAKTEEWSELTHLTMRARIARFPISEDTR